MDNKRYTFVFMGVSGSGKSTIAASTAQQVDAPFLDGDFLHPRANIDKMAAGQALNDEDRAPWLTALNAAIYAMQRTHKVSILVSSALKRKYRDALRKDNQGVYFVYLKGSFELIAGRLQNRKGHFFRLDMLQSQFDALEEPLNNHNDVFTVDIERSLEQLIDHCVSLVNKTANQSTSQSETELTS